MKLLFAVITLFLIAGSNASALGGFEIREKSDAPGEADTPGFSLILIDTHSDDFLVTGFATVPKSFEAKGAGLILIDENGQRLCDVGVAESEGRGSTKRFEFSLRRDLLKNSALVAYRFSEETGINTAKFVLGTFAVNDPPKASKPPVPRKIWVAVAEFGLFEKYIGTDEFTQTDKVPLEKGQQYGFRLYLRGDGRSLPMKVEVEAPSAPKTWGEETEDLKISADGRVASHESMAPTEKLVEQLWEVADGDPEGEYQIRVFVSDQLIKTFKFTVWRETSS